jgi:two-component system, cell cycle response regulator DivK
VTTVLVIEDDERNRKLARDVLGAAAFLTLEAATAAEGIALAREQVPDVILMDLRLPDMGGAAATRILKGDQTTAAIPVVAMSALTLEGNDDWLQATGFAGAIEKPISVGSFPDEVRRFCDEPLPS